jgi:hypothetical protein
MLGWCVAQYGQSFMNHLLVSVLADHVELRDGLDELTGVIILDLLSSHDVTLLFKHWLQPPTTTHPGPLPTNWALQ